jgi:hypothetical protein
MDWMFSLYNGFNVGLERKVNAPTWAMFEEEDNYNIYYFSGLVVNLGFFRLHAGEFLDTDEFIELMNSMDKTEEP